ncbi:hypothetical protein [Xanthomonas campestris]|uniref:hypothetical protein n=1 Tax=Xanthomonas campestris TaxID=339 RepID=UPI001F5B8190|nr:hypothetical protein [Xanthomonas campestris]
MLQSGRPINCQGYIPLDDIPQPDQGNLSGYSGSSFYCLNAEGTRELRQRGDEGRTPWTWTFDLAAAYIPNWADNKWSLPAHRRGTLRGRMPRKRFTRMYLQRVPR